MKRIPEAPWWCYRPGQSIEEIVTEAAAHYEKKRGMRPSLCLVRVCAFEELPAEVDGIKVEECQSMLAFHVGLCA